MEPTLLRGVLISVERSALQSIPLKRRWRRGGAAGVGLLRSARSCKISGPRMNRYPAVVFVFFLSLRLLSAREAVVTIDVHSAKNLLASGHRFLDVRTREEFNKGHVGNAINIPYLFYTPEGAKKNARFLEEVSAVYTKEDHFVVGCRSGVRSLDASVELLKAGYKNVKNMEGGHLAWVEKGFDVRVLEDEL